ncbi:MAG: 2OG-Fe dioxygenase family protein [Burkholderiales bacterium]|nr:2OG-Fe dioxygenase family protein [Burkholderiales bacterium]MDE2564533.1 2OG-Fe dioxygenase family protein [Burkholderiales bacterium]
MPSPTAPPPPPPLTALADLPAQLAAAGWAVLDAAALCSLAGVPEMPTGWPALWATLPPDPHLRDGGRYRRRRHGCFVIEHGQVQAAPHRAHWQPVEYNALHGGIQRWFEPLTPELTADPAWPRLLLALATVAESLHGPARWFVEAHPFRIDTGGEGAIGRPTPEGAHRDGVDLVAVLLVDRHNVKGGETRVFDARGPQGVRFTLHERWSALVLDDARVIHETTPIQPLDAAQPAWRDTLVLTLRRGGFQGPAER